MDFEIDLQWVRYIYIVYEEALCSEGKGGFAMNRMGNWFPERSGKRFELSGFGS